MVDLVVKFKICEVLKCSECVYGYRIRIQGHEKIGCKVMDAVVSVPLFAKAIDDISKMNWTEIAGKLIGMATGGKKDASQNESEKPT